MRLGVRCQAQLGRVPAPLLQAQSIPSLAILQQARLKPIGYSVIWPSAAKVY
jgi:hypothetical protein